MQEYSTYLIRSFYISISLTITMIALYIFNIQMTLLELLYNISLLSLCNEAEALYSTIESITGKSVADITLVSLAYLSTYAPLFFIVAFYVQAKNEKKHILLAGGDRTDEKTLHNLIAKDAKRTGGDARIFLGKNKKSRGIPILENDEPRSFFFLGKAGAGKTQGIKNFIKCLLDNPRSDSFVIYERKGDDYLYMLREGDYLFSPNDERSVRWNIWSDLNSESDIDFLISVLFPDSDGVSKDNHFDEQAKILMKTILLHIKDTAPSNKGMIDFFLENADGLKLRNTLLNSQTVRKYGLASDVEATLTLRDEALDGQAQSVMATLNRYRSALKLRCMYFAEGDFSVREFIQNIDSGNPKRLLLYNPAKQDGEQYAIYLNLLICFMYREALSLKNNSKRRIWFVLDEVQTLGNGGMEKIGKGTLKKTEEFLAQCRSKGGCVVIGTQSLEALENLINKNNMMSLLQLLSTKVLYQYDSPVGTGIISQFIGKQKLEKEKVSVNTTADFGRTTTSTSQSESTEDILLSSELNTLMPLEAYIKYSGYPLAKIRFEPIQTKQTIEEFIKRDVPFFGVNEPKKKMLFDESKNDEWESLY
jgi:predicted peroxiredoxin